MELPEVDCTFSPLVLPGSGGLPLLDVNWDPSSARGGILPLLVMFDLKLPWKSRSPLSRQVAWNKSNVWKCQDILLTKLDLNTGLTEEVHGKLPSFHVRDLTVSN